MTSRKGLSLVLVWHFHQPWYLVGDELLLPWTRLHTTANYYKMAYILSRHPEIRVAFTFSGSLLAQLEIYSEKGLVDRHAKITKKLAEGYELTAEEKKAMLSIPGGFFDINQDRIVSKVPRYRELKDKLTRISQEYDLLTDRDYEEKLTSSFTDQDLIDIAFLFNLFWTDPLILREECPTLYEVRENAVRGNIARFEREQLSILLNFHEKIMKKTIGFFRELAHSKQAELILVPYSHPLSPILADLGWLEDLEIHIEKSIDLFLRLFGLRPKTIWPPELAVNNDVLELYSRFFDSAITDKSLLAKSGIDISTPRNTLRPWLFKTESGHKLYVYFRDTGLSDLISFVYHTMDAKTAVNDFINRLRSIKNTLETSVDAVTVVALDGENPWEWYEAFGDTFLDTLYSELAAMQSQGEMSMTIITDITEKLSSIDLSELPLTRQKYLDIAGKNIADIPMSFERDGYNEIPRRTVYARIAEGSWAGGELAKWIGRRQKNAAWAILAQTRNDVLKALNTTSIKDAYRRSPRAVENLLRAEASDWFWWYGDSPEFPVNKLFKHYLAEAYKSIGFSLPKYLAASFNLDGTPAGVLNTEAPKPAANPPVIDGVLDDEIWLHPLKLPIRSDVIDEVLLAVDKDNLYLAIVPGPRQSLKSIREVTASIYVASPWRSVDPRHPGYNVYPRGASNDIGMGLFFEIEVTIPNLDAAVNAADGSEGWVKLYRVPQLALKDVVELAVPWFMIGLDKGDAAFVTAAIYRHGRLIGSATRRGKVYKIRVPK
ncbi:hypothetical protein [Pyrofollis japonicus]|uniref:hypothetical protein n=1 Tax=Pyrofollis japonicus TaxID=3060460 RepID=UPI00295C0B73|nr:hypothetical protein [Pyrofollis japonicus]